jgi:hypothetical protein
MMPMKPNARCPRAAVLAALATVLVAVAAAGCGTAGAHHGGTGNDAGNHWPGDHGKVVAYLPIPYQVSSDVDNGSAKTVNVTVRPGQRFSVKVATSDGPVLWRQVGPAPDGRVVSFVGDFNAGHCAKAAVGCRVPYFHILRARASGTTTMTWLYRDLACGLVRKKMTEPGRSCVAAVAFDITVR